MGPHLHGVGVGCLSNSPLVGPLSPLLTLLGPEKPLKFGPAIFYYFVISSMPFKWFLDYFIQDF